MFALFMGVGVLGMLMIMFRAAMYPCKLVFSKEAVQHQPYDDEDEWEEYQVSIIAHNSLCCHKESQSVPIRQIRHTSIT
jgi:hypothetical protein